MRWKRNRQRVKFLFNVHFNCTQIKTNENNIENNNNTKKKKTNNNTKKRSKLKKEKKCRKDVCNVWIEIFHNNFIIIIIIIILHTKQILTNLNCNKLPRYKRVYKSSEKFKMAEWTWILSFINKLHFFIVNDKKAIQVENNKQRDI